MRMISKNRDFESCFPTYPIKKYYLTLLAFKCIFYKIGIKPKKWIKKTYIFKQKS